MHFLRVIAGQDRGARRPAAGGVVELREAHPLPGERVQVRRGDLAAVARRVGEAHVVGEDEQDIRPVGAHGHGQDRKHEQQDR